tara:strand:- start:877 stop:1224 length:348 start_codon:yes stop_codon:yes gene_type:complete
MISIYYNPKCSKSRKTLEILKEKNEQPKVIQYLLETPKDSELMQIANMLNKEISELIRMEEISIEYGSSLLSMDTNSISKWLSDNPKYIERPIVINHKKNKAVICRPPDKVLEVL